MRRFHGMIFLLVIALLVVSPQGISAQVYNVDPELQQVYKYFTGRSLSDEVRRCDSIAGNFDTLRSMSEPPARNCYWHPPEGSGIVSLPDIPEPPLTAEQLEHHHSTRVLANGVRVFNVTVKYSGDLAPLADICLNRIRLGTNRIEGAVGARFPIEKLVDVVRLQCVVGVIQQRTLQMH